MSKNRIMEMVKSYRSEIRPEQELNIAEMMNLMDCSKNQTELVENAYLYGHMRASYDSGLTMQVPLYNLRQMSDEEWRCLASRNKAERQVAL